MLSGMPAIVTIDKNNNCKLVIDNCAPYVITISRNDVIALMDIETEQLQPLKDSVISAILNDIDQKSPKVSKHKLTKEEIAAKAHLKVPNKYKHRYIDILYRHQKDISANKYDLGLASNFKHKIHLKDNNQKTENSSKFQKHTKISSNNL
jgi:hypothetical protein